MGEAWIVVSTSCSECGAHQAVRLLDHAPSPEDIKENELVLGGMYCIRTNSYEVTMNGEVVVNVE